MCMTFYAPTLCLFYPERNTLTVLTGSPIYQKKSVAYPNTVTCLLISIDLVKQIKSNQLTTLLIVYVLDDTCEITCTQSILAPIAQLVECPHRGTGGHGFDPGLRHIKVVKNGTSCSSLGTQTYWVELGLVDPVSG